METKSQTEPTPRRTVRPESVAALGETVRQAAAAGQAVYPVGGRTLLDVGLPPSKPGLEVDLRGLDQVIDYPARDMTITVQAGITMARLQAVLAAENQRLPVDVPRPEQATLGGALAVNVSGPRRLGAGTFRDYVIGITVINDEGQETKAGGRVVKNVAGYDLNKLHVGALGTLGIISQVTLKVRPKPEAQALLTLGCESAALPALLDLLHATRTRPQCLELLNQESARAISASAGLDLPTTPWVLVVGFEESEESVSWQMQQLIREISTAGVRGADARAGASSDPLWQALTELTHPGDAVISFKANLLPSALPQFCATALARMPGVRLLAHAGSGIVRGHLLADVAGPALTAEGAAVMLKELIELASANHGNVTLPRCPEAWKHVLPVWGKAPGDVWLMRQVKDQLDPRHLFNPGRFVDGI